MSVREEGRRLVEFAFFCSFADEMRAPEIFFACLISSLAHVENNTGMTGVVNAAVSIQKLSS